MNKQKYEELKNRMKEREESVVTGERSQEELLGSNEILRAIINTSPLAIIISDLNKKVIMWNPAAEKIFGWKKEEVIGKPVPIVLTDRQHEFQENFTSLMTGEQYVFNDLRCQRKDGSLIEVSVSTSPLYDSKGNIVGAFAIIGDITEKKKTEEALLESESKYRLLAENMRDIVFVEDLNMNLQYISPSSLELLGYTEDELRQLKKTDYMTPESFRKLMERFRKYIAIAQKDPSFEIPLMENEFVRKDGTIFTGEMKVTFLRDSNGTITGSQGIIRDVTERKRLEEQLQIRQKMDSLGTLAGGIAHDFNNLLTGIMGNIDMLKLDAEEFNESQKRCLDAALKSCERAASLIGKFQMFSKGIFNKKEQFDMYDAAQGVFDVLERTTDKLIKKKIKFNKGEYFINAARSELHQVFLNLATNAVEAITKKGVGKDNYITINAEDCSLSDDEIVFEGEYIHISFKDTGVGMPDEVKRKAFDPLFTTKEKGTKKGQGLGLTMVYNIIRNHKGHIAIESVEGKGTTFHIYLPKVPMVHSSQREEESKTAGGNETILVVEDEEVVLNLAKTILEKSGYNVITAEDGRKGLDEYVRNGEIIDLVILDLTMPELSGEMVFEEMLKLNKNVRVIISSGHGDEETRRGVLALAKGHVNKPYKMKDLIRTVKSALDSGDVQS